MAGFDQLITWSLISPISVVAWTCQITISTIKLAGVWNKDLSIIIFIYDNLRVKVVKQQYASYFDYSDDINTTSGDIDLLCSRRGIYSGQEVAQHSLVNENLVRWGHLWSFLHVQRISSSQFIPHDEGWTGVSYSTLHAWRKGQGKAKLVHQHSVPKGGCLGVKHPLLFVFYL